MNDDLYTDERNPMRLPFRAIEIATLVLVAVIATGIFTAGGYLARRPLLADLASANAAIAEAQDIAADATQVAADARRDADGLSLRLESAEASATLSDDALGDIIAKLDALGFKTTVSDEGTVTLTPPKVIPQRAPAKKPAVVKTSYNTGGVEQWRGLVAKYFRAANVNAALSVMRQESGGNPNATNSSSGCAGLFQIHPCHLVKFKSVTGSSDLHDPTANIRFAAYMSAGGSNWISWTAQP